MLICQNIVLDPNLEQAALFHAHAAAARIMRNDLLALWVDEGRRLPGFRRKLGELRPPSTGGSSRTTRGCGNSPRTR